ncbi:MAG: SusC/RagA family TonB-linked outer membrane protein, partial [Bacteroidota bacterium]
FDRRATKMVNSFYALINLNFGYFAFFDFTGRNDWSSALATPQNADNVSFFYPSVSAALVPSELIEMPSIVSFFKLRGSWYQVGNDTGPYQTAGVFEASTPYAGLPTFTDQSTITNSALLPEKKTATEFGFVIGLLDQRIDVDFTYYNELTEDQIITLPVSIASGYTQQVVNGSKVRSKGLEVIVGANWINQTNLKWNTTFNFSRNVTSIEALPQGVDRLTLAYSRVYDNVSQTVFFQVEEGGRVGDMYGTGYLRNEQGEFIISEQGTFIADNRLQKLGNYNPDFMLGMQNSLAFKNWTWNMLWDWRQGGILVSRTLALAAVGGQLKETANRPDEGIVAQGVVRVGGTDENPVYEPNTTAISAETYYRNFYDRNHEENNTYNAGYLKLRELSIGYRFSGGFFKNGRSLNISIIGRNLFAFSEIPHFDPEQLAVQGQQFVNGVEDMSYATTRSFGVKIGLNL